MFIITFVFALCYFPIFCFISPNRMTRHIVAQPIQGGTGWVLNTTDVFDCRTQKRTSLGQPANRPVTILNSNLYFLSFCATL